MPQTDHSVLAWTLLSERVLDDCNARTASPGGIGWDEFQAAVARRLGLLAGPPDLAMALNAAAFRQSPSMTLAAAEAAAAELAAAPAPR